MFSKKSLILMIVAFLYGGANYLVDSKLSDSNGLYLIRTYGAIAVILSSILLALQGEPVFIIGTETILTTRTLSYILFSMMYFTADIVFFSMKDWGYSPAVTTVALALIPTSVIILTILLKWKLPSPSEMLLCVLVLTIMFVAEHGKTIDNFWYSFVGQK